MRRTIRSTGSRKDVSFTATTDTTAIGDCTSSAARSCCARGCGRPTSMERRAAWQSYSGSCPRFDRYGRRFASCWSRTRRVVAKAEYLEKGENPRFIVTSLDPEPWPAQPLYEEHYCARGDMENRLKEQLMLFSDRTSTAYLRSNQLRLYFSSLAYVLLQSLRRLGLEGTELGPGPVRHPPAEAAQDRCPDPHHRAQGMGLARRGISLCRIIPADSYQALCHTA